MPFRPGLDDHDALQRLLADYAATAADLQSQLSRTLAEIEDLLLTGRDSNRARRLSILARDLEDLRGVALSMVDGLTQSTAAFLGEPNLAQIYAAGAAKIAGFRFTATHQAAVDIIAQDLMGRALARTDYVDEASKAWVNRVSRKLTSYKVTQGVPVKTQARRFIAELEGEFTARGAAGVVYRDGSRHSFMEYGEMLLRTRTGYAYNVGTLNAGRAAGIEFYELLDGAECGLTGHKSTPLANGLIVDVPTALSWPLSHPNCRRAVSPRPDITNANMATSTSVQSEESRADQAAFERLLAEQTARRQTRRFVAA